MCTSQFANPNQFVAKLIEPYLNDHNRRSMRYRVADGWESKDGFSTVIISVGRSVWYKLASYTAMTMCH